MNDRSKDNLVTCYNFTFAMSVILRGFLKEYGSMSKTAISPSPSPKENLRPASHTLVYCVECNVLGGSKPLNCSEIKPQEYYLVLIDILLYCQTNKIIFQYACFTIKIILVCSIHMDLNNITLILLLTH